MIGRRLSKQCKGRPITAAQINAAHNPLERFSRLRGAPGSISLPAGPMMAMQGLLFRVGLTDSAGIAGRQTSGTLLLGYSATVSDVSFQYASPGAVSLDFWKTQFDGYNLSHNAVAANAICVFWFVNAVWITGWEDCPSSS